MARFLLARVTSRSPAPATSRPGLTIGRLMAVAALAAAAGAAATRFIFGAGAPVEKPRAVRFGIEMTPSTAIGRTGGDHDLAISADGMRVAYVGTGGRLLLRSFDRLEAALIPGLDDARGPFFSPDGQWLAFFDTSGFLKKVQVSGGAPITIAAVSAPSRGGVWLDDNTIVFATNDPATGLLTVPASGGTPTALTTIDRATETDHVWPHAVPGIRGVLFTVAAAPRAQENPQVVLLDIDSGTRSLLLQGASDAHYVDSGHLVYLTATNELVPTVRAMPFDLPGRRPLGSSVIVTTVVSSASLAANFDVSRTGTLVYSPTTIDARTNTLAWVNRQGHETRIDAPARNYFYPRLSPDGTRIALDARDQQNDIWIWELAQQTLTRFTTSPAVDRFPVWTPDGRSLLFTSERDGPPNIYRQASAGTTQPERISSSPNIQVVTAVTPDASLAIVRESSPTANMMRLPLERPGRLAPLVSTPFVEQNGEISPDGRWLAYESNGTGHFEIFVRPFPAVEHGVWQVSTGGGTQPLWSRDGRELFFVAPSQALMTARIGRGPEWRASAPERLPVSVASCCNPIGGQGRTYDVGADGRFLIIKPTTADGNSIRFGLVAVVNWFEELTRLAPATGN